MSFSSLEIKETLCNALESAFEIKKPTEIQTKAIRKANKTTGDLSIRAETGSGKTLSFLIPIIDKLLDYKKEENTQTKRKSGAHALILCPTRELAIQTHTQCQSILSKVKPHWITSCLLVGSNSFSKDKTENSSKTRAKEKAVLRKGQTIVVATPGRLLDHLSNTVSFIVSSVSWIVFDEADRLIDLGFEKKTKEIISAVLEKTQLRPRLVVCSATLKEDDLFFAGISLQSLSVASCSSSSAIAIPKKLKQYSIVLSERERLFFLISFLSLFINGEIPIFSGNKKIIVFFSSCDSVDFYFSVWTKYIKGLFVNKKYIEQKSFSVENPVMKSVKKSSAFRLHGGIDQKIRTKTYKDFVDSKCSVLFCTDVAARGINVPDISFVLQYDAPFAKEEYLHRIGRTARANSPGSSLILLMPEEKGYISFLEKEGLIIKQLTLELITGDFNEKKKNMQPNIISNIISNDTELKSLGQKGILSFIRSYSTHKPEMRCFFHKKRLHLGGLATSFGLVVGVKEAHENQINASKNKRKRAG